MGLRHQDGGVPHRVLVGPDGFKGTATAAQIAAGIDAGVEAAGWDADLCPLSDGGEGFLDVLEVLGGDLRSALVTGPKGDRVEAEWRLAGNTAVVESARASGLVLAGGAEGNDPLAATSRGTGELIAEAIAAGASKVIVGVGGSAMTDGGFGALEALDESGGLGSAEVLVACDVTVGFLDAARIFGPQKGANAFQVELLEQRLAELLVAYRRRGCDLAHMPGSGAAGGLAGGLVVAGARIVQGFDLVAGLVGLKARIDAAELVITGEGRLDSTSWKGKVVGGVVATASESHTGVVVIAGQVSDDAFAGSDDNPGQVPDPITEVIDLSRVFGPELARADARGCVALAAEAILKAGPRRS